MSTELNDTYSLRGKVSLITGGASGIGIGIAITLAEAGSAIVIVDRDEDRMQEVVTNLKNSGHEAGCVRMDLADENSIVSGCAETLSRFGTPWALVNNAGLQDRELLLNGSASEWDRMHAVNARGPFLITREIARAMVEQGQGGRIINIGTAGLRGMIAKGHAAYLASKGALLALSHTSAFELIEHRITVNTVLPGAVATPGARAAKGPTPEGPARRPQPLGLCDPRDIGCAVRFFATPAAHRITNQVVAVDGGFSIT